eukprot:g45898.t1
MYFHHAIKTFVLFVLFIFSNLSLMLVGSIGTTVTVGRAQNGSSFLVVKVDAAPPSDWWRQQQQGHPPCIRGQGQLLQDGSASEVLSRKSVSGTRLLALWQPGLAVEPETLDCSRSREGGSWSRQGGSCNVISLEWGLLTSSRQQWSHGLLVAVGRERGLLALARWQSMVHPEQGPLVSSRQQRSQGLLVAIAVRLDRGLLVMSEAVTASHSWLWGECGFNMGLGLSEVGPAAKRWHLKRGDIYVDGSGTGGGEAVEEGSGTVQKDGTASQHSLPLRSRYVRVPCVCINTKDISVE